MALKRKKWSYKIPYNTKTYINTKRNTTFKRTNKGELIVIKWLIFKLNK